MIRTPLQRHIDVDETLNEVRLFLPHFNKDNVESVMKALQDEEGSDIPADVEGESYGNDSHETWGYRPRKRQPKVELNQMILAGFAQSLGISADPLFEAPESKQVIRLRVGLRRKSLYPHSSKSLISTSTIHL